jgi:hypothetical protein
MELVFLGKANTDGLNSAKLAPYLLCLPQASIGRIDSGGGQNYLSVISLPSLKLSPAPCRAAFFEPGRDSRIRERHTLIRKRPAPMHGGPFLFLGLHGPQASPVGLAILTAPRSDEDRSLGRHNRCPKAQSR